MLSVLKRMLMVVAFAAIVTVFGGFALIASGHQISPYLRLLAAYLDPPKTAVIVYTPTQEFTPPQPPISPTMPSIAPPDEFKPQAKAPVAPPTLPAHRLPPLSDRLAEINQLARQSLPVITRHCGKDATFRKEHTDAMQELVNKLTVNAKALRDPTSYAEAVLANDTINACLVMWRQAEDFVVVVRCINDASEKPVAPSASIKRNATTNEEDL